MPTTNRRDFVRLGSAAAAALLVARPGQAAELDLSQLRLHRHTAGVPGANQTRHLVIPHRQHTGHEPVAFDPDRHYLSVAVSGCYCYFKRGADYNVVTGKLELVLEQSETGADERYQFTLKPNAFAPETESLAAVRNQAVVISRAQTAANLGLKVQLSAHKPDDPVIRQVNEVAEAGLDWLGGILASAIDLSPMRAVFQTVNTFFGGLFRKSPPGAIQISGPDGIETSLILFGSAVLGHPRNFVLFHNGNGDVAAEHLVVDDASGAPDVVWADDGSPFRDGGWLLLEIQRHEQYAGPKRIWHDALLAWEHDVAQQTAAPQQPASLSPAADRPAWLDPASLEARAWRIHGQIECDNILSSLERVERKAAIVSRLEGLGKARAAGGSAA